MSFAAPLLLLLLLVLPLGALAVHAARRRNRRFAVRMPAVSTLRAIVDRQPRYRRWLPAALLGVALTLMVVAIARPEVSVSVPTDRSSVVLVTDASGSMQATDVQPTRIDAARNAALNFLDRVPPQTRVGLVGYSTSPHTIQQPTTDRQVVRDALDGLRADGATATGDALRVALQALKQERDSSKALPGNLPSGAILLLSDGATSDGEDPLAVAQQAKRDGIPIYTVSLGTDAGQVVIQGQQLSVPPDPKTMAEIARISGGQTFAVDDAGELDKVYKQVGSRVSSETEQREISAIFAGGALIVLLLAAGLGLLWRSRIA